jgi:hypothetical protein
MILRQPLNDGGNKNSLAAITRNEVLTHPGIFLNQPHRTMC